MTVAGLQEMVLEAPGLEELAKEATSLEELASKGSHRVRKVQFF